VLLLTTPRRECTYKTLTSLLNHLDLVFRQRGSFFLLHTLCANGVLQPNATMGLSAANTCTLYPALQDPSRPATVTTTNSKMAESCNRRCSKGRTRRGGRKTTPDEWSHQHVTEYFRDGLVGLVSLDQCANSAAQQHRHLALCLWMRAQRRLVPACTLSGCALSNQPPVHRGTHHAAVVATTLLM